MWFKCEDRLPPKDGIYMTVEQGFMHSHLYRIATYKKNLGKVIGLEEHRGESGFYDSDSEWGSFVVKPLAWHYIERYEG